MNQMMILKNIKILKKNNLEEFPSVEVRYDDTEVFANLPIAFIPYGEQYIDPIMYQVNGQGIGMLIEREQLREALKKSKLFFFKLGENQELIECKKEESITHARLPHDVDLTKLAYMNGQVLMVEPEKEVENKEEVDNG